MKTWRRMGIALSIVWLLAAGYWANSAGLHKGDFAVTQFRACIVNASDPGNAGGGCVDQFDKDYAQAIKGHLQQGLMAGIVPVLLAWLLVYGLRRRRQF
jgi:hypothetical protein